MFKAIVIAGCALGLAACSGSSGSTGSGSSGGSGSGGSSGGGFADACATNAKLACAAHQGCFPIEFANEYSDTHDCEAAYASSCEAYFTLPGVAVTPAQLEACYAQHASQSGCELFSWFYRMNNDERTGPCVYPAGELEAGASCASGIQCASNRCAIPADQACGTCAARVEDGGACESTDDCNLDLVCSGGSCVPLAAADGGCSDTRPCPFAHTCVGGTCQASLALDAGCAPIDVACGGDLYCDSTTRHCAPDPTSTDGGCGNRGGAQVLCPHGTVCKLDNLVRSTGTCVAAATEGQPCELDPMSGSTCAPPLGCTNGTCTIAAPVCQ